MAPTRRGHPIKVVKDFFRESDHIELARRAIIDTQHSITTPRRSDNYTSALRKWLS